VDLFVTTFGQCYGDDSPRWTGSVAGDDNDGWSFVLLQPFASFARHDIDCVSPLTDWAHPTSSRDKIRLRFRQAGRPYNTTNAATSPHAFEVVRPLHLGEALVEWWRDPRTDTDDGTDGADGNHGGGSALVRGGVHPDLACSGTLRLPVYQALTTGEAL
jgi:hypothetical protein